MPESRDRLSRQDSIIASYSQRRISRTGIANNGRGNSIAFVLEDDNEVEQAARTPFRWRDTAMAGTPASIGVVAAGDNGTPRIRRIAPLTGSQNFSPMVGSGRGRGGGGVLPTWYPRRPLNDITAVVRAMERRRERREDAEGLITETPIRATHDHNHDHLEHKTAIVSPLMFLNKRCPPSIGKVPKILLNITHQNKGDTECLTPQKKLLNSIDTVEKVVMEELRKLKRTPYAKKAEREKRVRTLLSMR